MHKHLGTALLLLVLSFLPATGRAQDTSGKNDTILLSAIQVDNQLYPLVFIDNVDVLAAILDPQRKAELARLRYNVYKVYPYAVTAAYVMNSVDKEMAIRTKRKDRKEYLKQIEKEMNARFKNELKDLSMTQGQILVKLINRETGKDCYSLIKELKGGLNARIYQTAAFFFNNDLKRQYDPFNKDRDIETIVQEIEAKNYSRYQMQLQQKRMTN
ncbi:DUF4294 domain-containing protein [Taibaiella chishuiensis]|uniref:Uncharacterized protein DUF4294 n=1 Tax=Taibaiella chishuiensis TaxID=1434707 RepID=A0A2P8DCA2_9BACT|nr:DUF4294 domain-containing protein [Taibaiella chishuiensis]PSK94851.1 uncharacterized protein DUF4294 [Taibaiella chishuiensis]